LLAEQYLEKVDRARSDQRRHKWLASDCGHWLEVVEAMGRSSADLEHAYLIHKLRRRIRRELAAAAACDGQIERIRQAIDSALPDETDRAITTLHFIDGLTWEEVARRLYYAETSSVMHRWARRIRPALEKYIATN
jgi:hypothetical protein